MHPTCERLVDITTSPFSFCTAWTLLDPLLPLKTWFGNGRGGKGASCSSSKKSLDLDVYRKDFVGGSQRNGAELRGVTEENSFDVACGWHYYFSFKNRDTVAGKLKMLAHVSLAVEVIYSLFSVAEKRVVIIADKYKAQILWALFQVQAVHTLLAALSRIFWSGLL